MLPESFKDMLSASKSQVSLNLTPWRHSMNPESEPLELGFEEIDLEELLGENGLSEALSDLSDNPNTGDSE
jgi:hypothetical protein